MKMRPRTGAVIDWSKRPSSILKFDRVMTWTFADAPRALRLLHRTTTPPEWLVFVPQHLIGADLEEIITRNAESTGVFRYETPAWDVVYMGNSRTTEASCVDSPPLTLGPSASAR